MLRDQLKQDMTAAFKSGDQLRRSVLSLVLSAIKNRELDKRSRLSKGGLEGTDLESQSALDDTEVLEVLASEVKKRKDSAEQFRNGGRPELADKEESEMKILQSYLPEQLDSEMIRSEILATINEVGAGGAQDTGKVMSAVMAKLKGRADGALVSQMVKELLK